MRPDKAATAALTTGSEMAAEVLAFRFKAQKRRTKGLRVHTQKMHARAKSRGFAEEPAPATVDTAGVLVAEGDSWFDYPLHDVLEMLEDDHGYDVESVAHKGDPIEEMAYGGNQLEEFTRRVEKLLRRNVVPRAILLSGGGNDVAGDAFEM